MKTKLSILALFFLCNLSAQKNCATCWGQNDTVPTLTKQDKQALRLYSNLNWYDFSTYKFKGEGKRIVWIAYFAAGVLHGGREAYYAEPTVFEKRLNARPQSFFGSEQWKRNYFDRDPDNGHKPNIWNPVRDYYHFSGVHHKNGMDRRGFYNRYEQPAYEIQIIGLADRYFDNERNRFTHLQHS